MTQVNNICAKLVYLQNKMAHCDSRAAIYMLSSHRCHAALDLPRVHPVRNDPCKAQQRAENNFRIKTTLT